MRFLNYKLILFTLIFGSGVVFGFYKAIPHSLVWLIASGCVALATHYLAKTHQKFSRVSYLSLIICTFLLGYLNTQTRQPEQINSHYLNLDIETDQPVYLNAQVTQKLKPNRFYDNYVITVSTIDKQATKGQMLLKIAKDSTQSMSLKVGDGLIGSFMLHEFKAPENPQNFNYKKYMEQQQIYRSVTTRTKDFEHQSRDRFNLYKTANSIRSHLDQSLRRYDFNLQNIALIDAFILGDRQHLSKETMADFRDAGVVHILAVSGLHVGIILLLFNLITKPLSFTKLGRRLRPFVVILGLWGFAVLAGLSPSVFRATVMFSFLSLGLLLQRRTNPLNTLCLSGLVLVLNNPYIIFQVGFQLSYLAVVGILMLQPKLSCYYSPKFWLDRLLWDTLTVSLAAQIAILPLSLYYFNQFSGIFILSNLIILPFLGLILGLGIITLALAAAQILPEVLVTLFNHALSMLRLVINRLSELEALQFKYVYFTEPLLWTSLVFILTLFFWNKRYKKLSYFALNTSLILLCFTIYSTYKDYQLQQKLIILKSFNSVELLQVKGSNLKVFTTAESDSVNMINSYTINSARHKFGSQHVHIENLANAYLVNDSTSLQVIDSTAIYQKLDNHRQIILLTESPKLNLDRLIQQLEPQLIIAASNNYRSYVDRWKKTCQLKNIAFYSVYEQGAYDLREFKSWIEN